VDVAHKIGVLGDTIEAGFPEVSSPKLLPTPLNLLPDLPLFGHGSFLLYWLTSATLPEYPEYGLIRTSSRDLCSAELLAQLARAAARERKEFDHQTAAVR